MYSKIDPTFAMMVRIGINNFMIWQSSDGKLIVLEMEIECTDIGERSVTYPIFPLSNSDVNISDANF